MNTRRQFLLILGSSCAARLAQAESLCSVTRSSWALGSEVSITALHIGQRIAAEAVNAAFAELELVEQVMSLYRSDSQVCQLNRRGQLDAPHLYLVEVLEFARAMSQQTGGAFDITVQPLWELFSSHGKLGRVPEESAIERARERVDWRRVEVTPTRVRLHGEGTAITLNGIAQGFAADRALAALRRCGVEQGLLNTGEIGALGSNGEGRPWTVGIQHPRHADAYLTLTKIAGRCLATSGDYATSFSPDFRLHHVFDPRTGRSPTELASVSVAAETAMQADAISTAAMVLGPQRGCELVRRTQGADGLFVLKTGRVLATEGFAR
jgi:thiamine biosynthesis lipoprotein